MLEYAQHNSIQSWYVIKEVKQLAMLQIVEGHDKDEVFFMCPVCEQEQIKMVFVRDEDNVNIFDCEYSLISDGSFPQMCNTCAGKAIIQMLQAGMIANDDEFSWRFDKNTPNRYIKYLYRQAGFGGD